MRYRPRRPKGENVAAFTKSPRGRLTKARRNCSAEGRFHKVCLISRRTELSDSADKLRLKQIRSTIFELNDHWIDCCAFRLVLSIICQPKPPEVTGVESPLNSRPSRTGGQPLLPFATRRKGKPWIALPSFVIARAPRRKGGAPYFPLAAVFARTRDRLEV